MTKFFRNADMSVFAQQLNDKVKLAISITTHFKPYLLTYKILEACPQKKHERFIFQAYREEKVEAECRTGIKQYIQYSVDITCKRCIQGETL